MIEQLQMIRQLILTIVLFAIAIVGFIELRRLRKERKEWEAKYGARIGESGK